MKLLYIWVESYGNGLIQNQGFALSPKYRVEVTKCDVTEHNISYEIQLKSNSNFIENFYEKNIFDITAIVGQNGSGKTTLAHMLMEYMPTVLKIKNALSSAVSSFLIYEIDDPVGKFDKPELLVVYNHVNVKVHCKEIAIKIISVDTLLLDKTLGEQVQDMIYISNVFNPAELKENFIIGNTTQGNERCQQVYTPALNMKTYQQEYRKAFHMMYSTRYNAAIYQLAEAQSADALELYTYYQANSFINCYFHSPQTIKKALPVFHSIRFSLKSFGKEVKLSDKEKQTAHDGLKNNNVQLREEHFIYIAKSSVYDRIQFKNQSGNLKIHLLSCLLTEVFLLFIGPDFNKERRMISEFIDNQAYDQIDLWNKLNFSLNDNRNSDAVSYGKKIYQIYYTDAKNIINFKEMDIDNKTLALKEAAPFLRFYEKAFQDFRPWIKYISLDLQNTSSGEVALVNIISYMYQALSNLKGTKGKDILIVIDEIDAYLHPRWQQQILKWLVEWCKEDDLFKDFRFQFVLTSHSPILLSDIPADKVLKLSRNEEGQIYLEDANETFGADIYTLYYDSFFMDEGSIGEISKEKITRLIDWLNAPQTNTPEEDLYIPEAEYIISSVGDKNAKQQLQRMYQRKMKIKYQDKMPLHIPDHLTQDEQNLFLEYIKWRDAHSDKN